MNPVAEWANKLWNRFSQRALSRLLVGCLGVCALISIAPRILAQSGGGYDLRGTVQSDGGGMLMGANGYSLNGTVAQPHANPLGAMTGANNYALSGGFWIDLGQGDVIFRDGFESSP